MTHGRSRDEQALGDPTNLGLVEGTALTQPDLARAVHAPAGALGIGIVGAGLIVRSAHLPAYRSGGFPVIALYDQNLERAQAVAAEFGIPVVPTLDELLARDDVRVVDIAVPPRAQAGILLAAVEAGKHILAQKPLAESAAEAADLVRAAHLAGVRLGVNQNGRWDPTVFRCRQLLSAGVLGEPVFASIERVGPARWHLWRWLAERPRALILHDAIHFLDAFRVWFGNPSGVLATTASDGRAGIAGETSAVIQIDWPSGARAVLIDHTNEWAGEERCTFRVEGSEGVAAGSLGVFYNYPSGRPDTLEVRLRSGNLVPLHELAGSWLPDGIGGAMGALQRAVLGSSPLETDGADHLHTLRLVDAAYTSAATGCRVAVC